MPVLVYSSDGYKLTSWWWNLTPYGTHPPLSSVDQSAPLFVWRHYWRLAEARTLWLAGGRVAGYRVSGCLAPARTGDRVLATVERVGRSPMIRGVSRDRVKPEISIVKMVHFDGCVSRVFCSRQWILIWGYGNFGMCFLEQCHFSDMIIWGYGNFEIWYFVDMVILGYGYLGTICSFWGTFYDIWRWLGPKIPKGYKKILLFFFSFAN